MTAVRAEGVGVEYLFDRHALGAHRGHPCTSFAKWRCSRP